MNYETRARFKRLYQEYLDLHARLPQAVGRDERHAIHRRISAIEPHLRVAQ